MTKMLTLRFALPAIGIVVLLGAVALSWQPDGKLHVHALNVDGEPVFAQTPTGKQILVGGSNSPSALLAALGSRMPFWDRDIDLVVVPRGDTRSLNGLLAVVDRYRVGQIVSVDIGDSRAGREWLDMIAAKNLNVIEPGSGIGVADGVALTLDRDGWVRIEAGTTSVGIGTPGSESRADVMVLDEVTDKTAVWLTSNLPQIIVTRSPVELDRLVEGIAFVSVETYSTELIFDGTQWNIHESP